MGNADGEMRLDILNDEGMIFHVREALDLRDGKCLQSARIGWQKGITNDKFDIGRQSAMLTRGQSRHIHMSLMCSCSAHNVASGNRAQSRALIPKGADLTPQTHSWSGFLHFHVRANTPCIRRRRHSRLGGMDHRNYLLAQEIRDHEAILVLETDFCKDVI
jgi:hypothetical protein